MDTSHPGKISPQRRLDQRIFLPGNSFCQAKKGKIAILLIKLAVLMFISNSKLNRDKKNK